MANLTLIRLGFLKVVFFEEVNLTSLLFIFKKRTNLISVKITVVKQHFFKVGWRLKNVGIICYVLTLLVSLYQGNVKISKKMRIWKKISGKMLLILLLSVIKNNASPSLSKIILWKNCKGRVKLTPSFLRLSFRWACAFSLNINLAWLSIDKIFLTK